MTHEYFLRTFIVLHSHMMFYRMSVDFCLRAIMVNPRTVSFKSDSLIPGLSCLSTYSLEKR